MKTNKKILVTVAICIMLISSCTVISFYPLYTEDVLIKNDIIIGKWESIEDAGFNSEDRDTLVWEITFNKEKQLKEFGNYTYSLVLYSKTDSIPEAKSEFQLHMVDLKGETYIDFFPIEWDWENIILGSHQIGVHTFAKIEIADSITISWFDPEWFEQMLENDKIRIKHEKNSKNILLTAQPKELQKFILKYSNEKAAFEDGMQYVLRR